MQACYTQPMQLLKAVAIEEIATPSPFSRYAAIAESSIKAIGAMIYSPDYVTKTLSNLQRAYETEKQDLDIRVKAWINQYLEIMSAHFEATGKIIDVDELACKYGGIINALEATTQPELLPAS